MKLCERCFRRIDDEETYCHICKLKMENEQLKVELKECNKNWKLDVRELEKEKLAMDECLKKMTDQFKLRLENVEGDYKWSNNARRHLMKELKGHGCCCKNCFWLSKCTDGTFTCSATRFDFKIEANRIDKSICYRYAFDKSDVKEN